MTIKTRSQFYYINPVTENNFTIPLLDDLGEVSAQVSVGSYSMTELSNAVAFALNSVGTQEYTVTLDRITREYTISSDNNFDLLFSSGVTVGQSIHPLLGFDNLDLTGSNSYTSQNAAGFSFRPQLFFQDYVDADNFQESVDASVNESASGKVEVITYGTNRFYELDIKYVTNKNLGKGSIIEFNPNAVDELRAFLRFATNKGNLELMKDRDNPQSFDTILLEKTPFSSNGTGFRINEMNNLDEFYDTGRLQFRVVN